MSMAPDLIKGRASEVPHAFRVVGTVCKSDSSEVNRPYDFAKNRFLQQSIVLY